MSFSEFPLFVLRFFKVFIICSRFSLFFQCFHCFFFKVFIVFSMIFLKVLKFSRFSRFSDFPGRGPPGPPLPQKKPNRMISLCLALFLSGGWGASLERGPDRLPGPTILVPEGRREGGAPLTHHERKTTKNNHSMWLCFCWAGGTPLWCGAQASGPSSLPEKVMTTLMNKLRIDGR